MTLLAACSGSGNSGASGGPTSAPVVTLSANPTSVTTGGTTVLTWSATNSPTSCTASGGWSGTKAASGTETSAALNANTAFTLNCTNAKGTGTRTVNVTVTPPAPPVVTLSANPTSVTTGGTTVLTWSATNSPTSCTASGGWSGAKAASGTETSAALIANTAFTLDCTNAGGTGTRTVNVTVTPPPAPTVTLTANPTTVLAGGTTALTWSSTNATSCTASGTGWNNPGARGTSGGPETSLALNAQTIFTLACTGAGGTTSRNVTVSIGTPPAPTATLSANPTTVSSGGTTQLTWSSTNATSCTASGAGWNNPGARAASGTETSLALTANTTFSLTCTGAGGTSPVQSVPVNVTTGVVISGQVTFERPTRTGNSLDYNTVQTAPARGVTIEVLQGAAGSTVLATTTTNATGNYSASIATSQQFRVRAKAELLRTGTAPTFNFKVLNNGNSNALYVLDSPATTPAGGSVTVNLLAPLGRSGTNGTTVTATRASAPFAIIDTMYQKKEMLVAAAPALAMPAINIYWATINTSTSPNTCGGDPNPVTGQIGTTFFLSADIPASIGCPLVPRGIYVLGDAAVDTDEFDGSVMAHESGHYYEDSFARGDSMGGPHSLQSVTDMRLAWSEGWGNAYSGMVLNDATYRDTYVGSPNNVFSFSMETDSTLVEGWFSEVSVGELLWDVFDAASDGSDSVSLGFAPVHQLMTTQLRTTNALGSVWVAFAGLITNNGGQATALRTLRNGESIAGTDDYGAGETNAAGLATTSLVLPPYTTLAMTTPVAITSSNRFPESDPVQFASYNRVGARRYFRVNLPAAANYRITAQGPGAGAPPVSDPDVYLYRRGVTVCSGAADSTQTNGLEDVTCNGLAAGEHVLEVFECSNLGEVCAGSGSTPRGDTAITVTITQVP